MKKTPSEIWIMLAENSPTENCFCQQSPVCYNCLERPDLPTLDEIAEWGPEDMKHWGLEAYEVQS